MMLDKLNQLSADQALTTDAISANVIDLGPVTNNVLRDIGAGEPLYLTILVTTTLDSTEEDATLITSLESDSAVGLDSSATVHWTSADILELTLVAGYFIAKSMPIPRGSYERYLGLRYNNTTHAFTSGKVSAWIHAGSFDVATAGGAYASGFSSGY